MSRPTPEELITEWERRKMVKAAERAVIEAAMASYCIDDDDLLAAVSKLREARGDAFVQASEDLGI